MLRELDVAGSGPPGAGPERIRAAPALATGAGSPACGTARGVSAARRKRAGTRGDRARHRRRTRNGEIAIALCVREGAREVGRMSGNEKFEREFEAFLTEEESRLAALYRKLPQAEPDAQARCSRAVRWRDATRQARATRTSRDGAGSRLSARPPASCLLPALPCAWARRCAATAMRLELRPRMSSAYLRARIQRRRRNCPGQCR